MYIYIMENIFKTKIRRTNSVSNDIMLWLSNRDTGSRLTDFLCTPLKKSWASSRFLFSGAGGRTRTYEARSARDLQSLVIATRRLQQFGSYGAVSRVWTGDLRLTMATLCQLSYHGILLYAKLFWNRLVQFFKVESLISLRPLAQFFNRGECLSLPWACSTAELTRQF